MCLEREKASYSGTTDNPSYKTSLVVKYIFSHPFGKYCKQEIAYVH